jgi:hypothetical protein
VLLCCNNYEKLEGDVVDKVKNLKYGGSSLLHNDLQSMVSRVSDNNIIFFVTDGIMSGTDTNIKKDKQWTKMHAADLKLKVKEIFSSHKDVAVSVYQFPAQFNGKYFCFDDSNVLINAQRYFYVFAIGKKDAVLEFKNKNVGTDYFKPSNQLHFIDQLPLSEGVNVKNSKRAAGVWNFDLKEINNKKDDPKMMIVTVKSDQFNAELNENQIEELSFHPNGNCGCILLYDDYAFGIRCSHLMWSEGHCEGVEGFWSEDDHTLAQERYSHNDYNSSYNSILVYGNHKGNLVIKMIVFHETTK